MLFLTPTRGARWRRAASAVTATALVSTALALTAPAAQADEPATSSLTWGISQQFREHFTASYMPGSDIVGTGGATYADELATYINGAGTYDEAAGTASVKYAGTIQGSFGTFYSVTISNPAVTVQGDGSGTLTAEVSGEESGGDASSTEPARVKVADFADAEIVDGAIVATPNWAGVLAPGSQEAADLELEAEDPEGGRSFAAEFLSQVTVGVRPHFYAAASSGSNAKKVPAAFTASLDGISAPAAATPTVTAKVVFATPARGLRLRVNGTGFNPTTNPGDAGVYVGLAPRNADIDLDDRDSIASFAAVDWVTPQRFNDDKWVSVLNIDRSKLKKGVKYSVYTWQAHTHSNESQDIIEDVAVPYAKLVKRRTPMAVKVTKRPTRKQFGRLRAVVKRVPGWAKPAGKVQVVLKKGKATRKAAARLKQGRAVVRLPKLAKGQWRATVRYAGNVNYKANKRVVRFRVVR